jgi:hypothetical protein
MRFSSKIKSEEQVAIAACEHGFALGTTRLFKMKKPRHPCSAINRTTKQSPREEEILFPRAYFVAFPSTLQAPGKDSTVRFSQIQPKPASQPPAHPAFRVFSRLRGSR